MLPASHVLRAALHLGLASMQVQRPEELLVKVADLLRLSGRCHTRMQFLTQLCFLS